MIRGGSVKSGSAPLIQEAIMTTIAYKDGVIAYESRCVRGDIIVNDDYNKMIKAEGAVFVFAGSTDQFEHLIRLYLGQETAVDEKDDTCAIVCDKGELYYIGVNPSDGYFKCDIECEYAIGSGSAHAYTAMDMGASAKEAVKMAIKRDIYSGGSVRTYKVK